MSTQSATRLLQELAQDPAFQSLMRETEDIDARISTILDAGAERGLDVSADDIRAVAGAGAPDGELDDDQLGVVAGGADETLLQMVVRWITPNNWDADGSSGGHAPRM